MISMTMVKKERRKIKWKNRIIIRCGLWWLWCSRDVSAFSFPWMSPDLWSHSNTPAEIFFLWLVMVEETSSSEQWISGYLLLCYTAFHFKYECDDDMILLLYNVAYFPALLLLCVLSSCALLVLERAFFYTLVR